MSDYVFSEKRKGKCDKRAKKRYAVYKKGGSSRVKSKKKEKK
jgi:hypothetical protein